VSHAGWLPLDVDVAEEGEIEGAGEGEVLGCSVVVGVKGMAGLDLLAAAAQLLDELSDDIQ